LDSPALLYLFFFALHFNQLREPTMSNLSYTFTEGQIVELFHGVPHDAWDVYSVPDEVLIRALEWNDSNGDFEGLERVRLLEIFLSDFIRSKGN
jgi:hypothetical protein